MKVNDLIDRTIQVVNDRLDIKSIVYRRHLDIDDPKHRISDEITVHYHLPSGKNTNFSATIYEREGLKSDLLFARIEENVVKILDSQLLNDIEL